MWVMTAKMVVVGSGRQVLSDYLNLISVSLMRSVGEGGQLLGGELFVVVFFFCGGRF